MPNAKPAKPATVAPQTARVASTEAAPKKTAAKRKAAPQAKKKAKAAPPEKSKADVILSLVGKKSGATLAAIMSATGWQAHSVRGFISLAISKRGLKIESAKNAKGERVYRLAR